MKVLDPGEALWRLMRPALEEEWRIAIHQAVFGKPNGPCDRHTWHREQQTGHTYCALCGQHK